MTTSVRKYSAAKWIEYCFAVLLVGCTSLQHVTAQGAESLPLGLYKVVERECNYALGVPEDCTRAQYIELVKGVFYGVGKDEIAFATWLAESPSEEHEYIARDLRRGKFTKSGEFVIDDDEYGKDWFVIENGLITDYFFVRHPRQASAEMAGKTHLSLQPVRRNTEVDRLLVYPPPEN